MRHFTAWLNARRRMAALALVGLIAVIVLSAGSRPDSEELFRVPDLSNLVLVAFGFVAVLGLGLLRWARPTAGPRRSGELRSIRIVLVLTVIVAVAMWMSPPQAQEEEPAPTAESLETVPDAAAGDATDPSTGVSGTDLATLLLIVLALAALTARNLRKALSAQPQALVVGDDPLDEGLAAALEKASFLLNEETDPRAGVLIAYATLEQALADLGMPRHPAETPTEHLARVLSDAPDLHEPVGRIGALYELARFSQAIITEEDREEAMLAVNRARERLAATERSTV